MSDKSLYEILGVAVEVTEAELKVAYRQKSKEHHPDKGGDPETMKLIVEAYEILSNPEKRERYDKTGEKQYRSFEVEFMDYVETIYMDVLSKNNYETDDLVNCFKDHAKDRIGELEEQMAAFELNIEILTKVKERLSTKGNTTLIAVTEKHIHDNAHKLAVVKSAQIFLTKCLLVYADYSYQLTKKSSSPRIDMMEAIRNGSFHISFDRGGGAR